MQNGFPYLDILIFGVIAIFLIFRLKNILGTKTDFEDNGLKEKKQPKQFSNVVSLKTNKNNSNVKVKCNTSLAETLINNKNNEISNLESTYNSKIKFVFDYQFSLHEPLVELEDQNKENKDKKIIKKNKIKKKTIIKKAEKKKKTIKIDKKNKKIPKNKEMISSDKHDENDSDIKEIKNKDIKTEEKTGWWS